MEAFLTPLVARLLSRFVRSSASGRDASDLRASLQGGGGLVLQNLELDLDAALAGLPVGVRRAFASQLTVSIPWTSLASQPIQVPLPSLSQHVLCCQWHASQMALPCHAPTHPLAYVAGAALTRHVDAAVSAEHACACSGCLGCCGGCPGCQ